MNHRAAATMPSGKQNAATTTLMVNILEAVDEVGNAAQTEDSADDSSPSATHQVSKSVLVAQSYHTYSVVCPEWYSVRVKVRWPHEGQSTGA